MEKEEVVPDKESSQRKGNSGYTFAEDMAIVNYIVAENRYLRSSGIKVWKDAEKLQICPGRPYLSMKERFRKVIVKNLNVYEVEKDVAVKIIQFMRANQKGKSTIRLKCS